MTSTRRTGSSAEPGAEGNKSGYDTAIAKARRLCASREYCISEIRAKIEEWALVPPQKSDEIIASLVSDRFIDEQRYASAFARDKLRYNKWGRIKISYALRMKDLPANVIAGALNGIDEQEYLLIASKLVERILKTKKKSDAGLLRASVVRSMQSKGFETAVIMKLLHGKN
ncbi:MAG: RecX family transcriptional regulator [Bacteroidetes bacterium]|nr:RecX family transcriptional regulator [Bacteroidota bacterium]